MLLTPVRMFADGVGSAYVLRYHRIAAHAFRGRCPSAPHTCSLHCSFLDTVACTPHLWKGTRLGRLTVLGNVLCWHQDPQNVLTAVALGEQLFDELEQTLQRVTSYRMHLLSDGDGALCERKPFCFRP